MNGDIEDIQEKIRYSTGIQAGLLLFAILVWVFVDFGPLSTSWHFLFAALAALISMYRGHLGKQLHDIRQEAIMEGEAGVFHALAGAHRPLTAKTLSSVIPHSTKETRYRLEKLRRDDLVEGVDKDGTTFYYVKSTGQTSVSESDDSEEEMSEIKEEEMT